MAGTRRRILCVVILGAVVGAGWFVVRHGQADDKAQAAAPEKSKKKDPAKAELAEFMHVKLDATDQILEGLVTDDLRLLLKGADKLKEMSEAEKWRVSNDMAYRRQSEDFQHCVEKLRRAVREESLDGAALAWFDTTMSCIECHKWVRRVLIADSKAPLTPGAIAAPAGAGSDSGGE